MRQVLGIPGHPKVINQNPCKHPGISKRLQGTVQQMGTFDALTKGLRSLLKRHKVNIFSQAPTYALHSMVPDRVSLPKLSLEIPEMPCLSPVLLGISLLLELLQELGTHPSLASREIAIESFSIIL